MKKLILSMCLVVGIINLSSVNAFALDGEEVTAPAGTQQEGDMVVSSGFATITSEDGTTFYTKNDDDAYAKEVDTDGANVDVWAKVVDSSTPVYKIDIEWGAMKFEFTSGEGRWDTDNHTYINSGDGESGWTVAGYLDNDNNKITVTNHSNNAVTAGFDYTMEQQAFNDETTVDSVVGNFFKDAAEAVVAADVLTNTATVANNLTEISIHTADKYYASAEDKATGEDAIQAAGARPEEVYFAFSGTPDAGRGKTLETFQKVGVITVTVKPMDDVNGFEY